MGRGNTGVELPKPLYTHGYSYEELPDFMTEDELAKFNKWIGGQTVAMEEGRIIYYSWDVQRFLENVRKNSKTYWD